MNPKDQIKENLSIVDVVSTYIRLEKSGSRFRARCPFHNERTPSFYISPERNSFHCFGCQVHGDIFTFVEKIENIPFYEALKILADRAGVSLKDSNRNKEESRLIALLKDATAHYEKNLGESPEAKQYLLERGLTNDTIATFHIGYAKNEWRDLFIALSQKGYMPEEMEQAGLMIKTEKSKPSAEFLADGSPAPSKDGAVRYYDRFRGRVMFPIRNVSGATVGYSGRILPSLVDPTVAQGKYVNTPETALYHKSKILFGYDTAKKTMSEQKAVVVVEGQMDLSMSYQAGIHNTVAVSGTAFTDEHIHLIKRFCDTVILSFDTDSAGQNALKKTALLCLLGGLDVYVVGDIGTKDPADLIVENPSLWLDAVKNKKHIIEKMVSTIMKEESDSRLQGRRIVSEVLPFVRAIQSPIDRDFFIKRIAEQSGITEQALSDEIARVLSQTIDEVVDESVQSKLSAKDRLTIELIACATLLDKLSKEEFLELAIDTTLFPEEIIQNELFALEERLVGDKDIFWHDLIVAYKKELHKEELFDLQERVKRGGEDADEALKEMYALAQKNHKKTR